MTTVTPPAATSRLITHISLCFGHVARQTRDILYADIVDENGKVSPAALDHLKDLLSKKQDIRFHLPQGGSRTEWAEANNTVRALVEDLRAASTTQPRSIFTFGNVSLADNAEAIAAQSVQASCRPY